MIAFRPPRELTRELAAIYQSLKLGTVCAAKVKADVTTPQAQGITHSGAAENLLSGGEH